MRALKIFIATLSGLLGLIWLVGIFLPGEYRIERSTVIDAPVPVVFEQVNDFHNWEGWSPWIAHDPTIDNTYRGPRSGVGAISSWTSEKSGDGTMTITESKPDEHITVELDFGDMGKAESYWDFEPEGKDTRVTWSMEGENEGAIGHYFTMFMDGMVGPYYEEGLASLKTQAEKAAAEREARADDPAEVRAEEEAKAEAEGDAAEAAAKAAVEAEDEEAAD